MVVKKLKELNRLVGKAGMVKDISEKNKEKQQEVKEMILDTIISFAMIESLEQKEVKNRNVGIYFSSCTPRVKHVVSISSIRLFSDREYVTRFESIIDVLEKAFEESKEKENEVNDKAKKILDLKKYLEV